MRFFAGLVFGFLFAQAGAEQIELRLTPRPPVGVEAFFLARGLPGEAAYAVSRRCVFHAHLKNLGQGPIRIRIDEWRLEALGKEKPVKRRKDWEALLKEVPEAAKASFRWTLFPDEMMLQPGEEIMGLLILDLPPGTPFSLVVSWHLDAKEAKMRFADLRCPSS